MGGGIYLYYSTMSGLFMKTILYFWARIHIFSSFECLCLNMNSVKVANYLVQTQFAVRYFTADEDNGFRQGRAYVFP